MNKPPNNVARQMFYLGKGESPRRWQNRRTGRQIWLRFLAMTFVGVAADIAVNTCGRLGDDDPPEH